MSDEHQVPRTTTDSGVPAPSDEHSLTAGPNGPTLLQDHYLVQKMQHFNRERVPERVVHARGEFTRHSHPIHFNSSGKRLI